MNNKKNIKDNTMLFSAPCPLPPALCLLLLCLLLPVPCSLISCSFEYDRESEADSGLPDIVMETVEYVRVRGADLQARFQAERVERYEERQVMDLYSFSFEQYGNRGEDVNAFGRAGSATFETDTGDILMSDGVRIDVESEDIAIETDWLQWKDRERILFSGEEDEVHIFQENGTVFTGIGFTANVRYRTWEFSGLVSGTYIYDEENDEENVTNEELPVLVYSGDSVMNQVAEAEGRAE